MAATLSFSHHSSNPLDRGSSDKLPNLSRFHDPTHSSDDPLHWDQDAQMREFVQHIESIHPAAGASIKNQMGKGPVKARRGEENFIDLDEDSSDDLELTVKLKPKGKKKGHERVEANEDELEYSEGEESDGVEEDAEDAEAEVEEEPSSADEDTSLSRKSADEQLEILAEIEDLERAVPELSDDYKLIDRLGTGTFSSVYKARDLNYHEKWYNAPWHGHHHISSSAYYQSAFRPSGSKVYVAVKRIYVTSSPERIRNEISILDECKSCRHVSQLITAFREDDQVVVIMPYQKNDDFRDYFTALPMAAIKKYMRCLFRALRDIHSRGIIHRDVKPANFLFDPRTGIGTLCDFGLACRMDLESKHTSLCLHTPPSKKRPHGELKKHKDYDKDYYKQMSKEAKMKSARPSEEVGYPEKDTRPHSKANRAGTRGFRAPEVLLKCGDQTGALDVWSAGMVLLFFLTKKFPLFQSNDDVEALMEIATIIGKKQMDQAACLHSRTFATNVPSITPDGISWTEFVTRQNPDLFTLPEPDVRFYPYTQQLQERALKQLVALESADDEHPPPFDHGRDQNTPEPDSYRVTPIPSSSPSHLSINVTDLSSASSLAFPSSSPKSYESGEMSPLTPIDEDVPNDISNLSLSLRGPTQEQYNRDVANALDLATKLLHPCCTSRMTPQSALYHPFLFNGTTDEERRRRHQRAKPVLIDEDTEMYAPLSEVQEAEAEGEDPEDDEFFPHPFGEGVCRRWHYRDEVGTPYVYVYAEGDGSDDTGAEDPVRRDDIDDIEFFAGGLGKRGGTVDGDNQNQMVIRRLVSGEGIAIGRQPCEFHTVGYELDLDIMIASPAK